MSLRIARLLSSFLRRVGWGDDLSAGKAVSRVPRELPNQWPYTTTFFLLFFGADICLTWRLLGQSVRSSRLVRRFPRRLDPGAQFLSPLASSKSSPPLLLNDTMPASEEDRPELPANPLSPGPGKSESDELGSLPLWICSTFKVPDATDSWAKTKQKEILPRHMDIGYIILVLLRKGGKGGLCSSTIGEGEFQFLQEKVFGPRAVLLLLLLLLSSLSYDRLMRAKNKHIMTPLYVRPKLTSQTHKSYFFLFFFSFLLSFPQSSPPPVSPPGHTPHALVLEW